MRADDSPTDPRWGAGLCHHHRFREASARSFHNGRCDILGKTCEKESRNGLRGGGNVRRAELAQQRG